MKNNRLLIISYYWPPSGGSGVQRWLNFSNYLIKIGWEITVFTAKNANYPLLDQKLNETVNDKIKVLRIPIFEPAGFFKTSDNDNINSSTIFNKLLNWIRANLFFPDSRMFWINKVANKSIKFINKNKINCLITTSPPFSTNLIGLKIKKETGVKWISDHRDPWSDFFQFKLLPISSYMKQKHLTYELRCLKYSDLVITTSPNLTSKYLSFNPNTHTIYNGFNSYINSKNSNKFLLMYCGQMKSIQNPRNLWIVLDEICKENINFSKDLSIKLIGNFDIELVNYIKSKSKNYEVKFEKYLEKKQLDNEVKNATILLLTGVDLKKVNNIIPGKLFYYFSIQRPIIAFSNLNSDISNIIKSTNTGEVFDYSNMIDLKNHILEQYKDFKSKTNNYKPQGVSNFTYETLSKKMSKLLKRTINGDST